MERIGEGSGEDNRSFFRSIAATLVADLLQAVSRLMLFAAEQDKALLAIQLATRAKQKKLAKQEKSTDPRTLRGEAAVETLAGPGIGTHPNTNTEPNTNMGPMADTEAEPDTRAIRGFPVVRKAKRAYFDSVDKMSRTG
jgi:hypothetical protein